MKLKHYTFFFIFLFLSPLSVAEVSLPPDIQQYVNGVSKEYHFDIDKLSKIMQQAHVNPTIIHAMNHPFEKKPYDFYRKHFVTQMRVSQGGTYWQSHQKQLDKIEHQYGVNSSIILAILGVETFYGQHKGGYNVLDSLTTLAFYYPKRSAFFKNELTQFLLLTRDQHIDPTTVKGSYAGALGIPQFMPSTYRHYAVDFAKNQHIDLMNNELDAMASVANYLKKSGWKHNQPVAIKLAHQKNIPKSIISKRMPHFLSHKKLADAGITLPKNHTWPDKVAIIAMQKKSGPEYWAVFPNYQAILRYNPRNNYALAAYELSKAIGNVHEQSTTR